MRRSGSRRPPHGRAPLLCLAIRFQAPCVVWGAAGSPDVATCRSNRLLFVRRGPRTPGPGDAHPFRLTRPGGRTSWHDFARNDEGRPRTRGRPTPPRLPMGDGLVATVTLFALRRDTPYRSRGSIRPFLSPSPRVPSGPRLGALATFKGVSRCSLRRWRLLEWRCHQRLSGCRKRPDRQSWSRSSCGTCPHLRRLVAGRQRPSA